MPFGLMGAVLDFNRVSAHLVAIARRWLAIPVVGFYDDYKLTELLASCPSADAAFTELVSWLGWSLDPGKHQKPAPSLTFLGTLEVTAFRGDVELFGLTPTPKRLADLRSDVEAIVGATSVSRGDIASLRGRVVHLVSTLQGRLGSSLTGQMTEALKGEGGRLEVRWALQRELRWLLALLDLNLWKVVNLASRRPSVTLITDASWGSGPRLLRRSHVCAGGSLRLDTRRSEKQLPSQSVSSRRVRTVTLRSWSPSSWQLLSRSSSSPPFFVVVL